MKNLPAEAFRRYDETPDTEFYRQPRLVTHIDERPTGQGLFDHATLLTAMERLGPERFVVIEHARPEEVPAAKAFLDRLAAELGLRVF